jgi:putative phosphoribosyl transferase
MMFASREDAGRRLGDYLRAEGVVTDWVAGLPRGGVLVAAEVARSLQRPLDVLIVRKIGHPLHREFAVGAIAEEGVIILDQQSLGSAPSIHAALEEVIAEETERLRQYQARFRPAGRPLFAGKSVLLVDDGLATGATIEAAALSVRKQNAARIVIAAPVASASAVERLRRVADDVRVLLVDPEFDAVGRYYETFAQTTDEEVLSVLQVVKVGQ